MKITFLVGGCGGVGWVSAEHYTPTVDCDTTHGTCVQQHRFPTVLWRVYSLHYTVMYNHEEAPVKKSRSRAESQ